MFVAGDVIIREGEIGDKVYFLRRGAVDILVGPGQKKVAQLNQGVAFGEMALFDSSGKRKATVRAADHCDCRTIDQRSFLRLLQSFPEDKAFFSKVAQQRGADLKKEPEQCRTWRASSERRAGRQILSKMPPVKGAS